MRFLWKSKKLHIYDASTPRHDRCYKYSMKLSVERTGNSFTFPSGMTATIHDGDSTMADAIEEHCNNLPSWATMWQSDFDERPKEEAAQKQ